MLCEHPRRDRPAVRSRALKPVPAFRTRPPGSGVCSRGKNPISVRHRTDILPANRLDCSLIPFHPVRESTGGMIFEGKPLDKHDRASGEPVTNHFLRALPTDSFKRLEPHLEPVDLAPGTSILRLGAPVRRVTFINRGFVSIVKTMQDGRTVEVGTNGNHDMVGLFGLLGIDHAVWDSVVQIPGSGLRIDNEVLRAEIDTHEPVRQLVMRYTYLVLSHLAQTAACHRLHSLSQRFSRWLLSAQRLRWKRYACR